MSISISAAQALVDRDYYEEIAGPTIERGYLVRTLEEVPKGYIHLKTNINLKTYTKQYTGLKNIGGYETYYTIVGSKTDFGYEVLTKKEYLEFLEEFKDSDVYVKQEYDKILKELNESENQKTNN